MVFNYDDTVQGYIRILVSCNRDEELYKICDSYCDFEKLSKDEIAEWSFNFGEFCGRYNFGELIWTFELENGMRMFFIGELEKIRERIYSIL